jgi:long-chain acyl-CoA synthetase
VYVDGGEIVVAGSPMLGYVDDPGSWYPAEVRTGDLGRVDARGFVHVEGRSRNVLITGFGRNVSPEWVESELLAAPLLAQAVVVGDTKPWCSALVLPRQECTTDETISAWIRDTNERLPDYARVLDWRRLPEPLTVANGLLTANGRPRRPVIEKRYQPLIDGLYENQPEASMQ